MADSKELQCSLFHDTSSSKMVWYKATLTDTIDFGIPGHTTNNGHEKA